MTTPVQVEANRKNAGRSTGPRTPAGKGRSSRNAVRHGLRSDLTVLPYEQADAWERHRDGVVRSLAPAGALEEALAFRVALCLWRLQRVAVYEAATATAAIEGVADEIARRDDGDPILVLLAAASDDARRLRKTEEELRKVRGHVEGAEAELAIVELLGEPEVRHLGNAVGRQQHVGGLEVAVDDVTAVGQVGRPRSRRRRAALRTVSVTSTRHRSSRSSSVGKRPAATPFQKLAKAAWATSRSSTSRRGNPCSFLRARPTMRGK